MFSSRVVLRAPVVDTLAPSRVLRKVPNVLAIQSHVVYGHAGNSAAVFPMRRLGVNVLPLNTVQYSNHTQYKQKWTGIVLPPGHITSIVEGIAAIDELSNIDAVLSGFLGSESQAAEVLEVVERVREANPAAVYLCDPVMGNEEKGCIVPPGVTDYLAKNMTTRSDFLCPNQLELNTFLGRTPTSFRDCVDMSVELFLRSRQGPVPCRALLVKNASYPGKQPNDFEMLLVEMGENNRPRVHLTRRPLFEFGRAPVGVGDLTSGIFLSKLLLGASHVESLEFTTASVHAVMEETFLRKSYELEIVAAQDAFASPLRHFSAEEVSL